MYQAYKYRIYPNAEQKEALARSFGCCRWYWNYAVNYPPITRAFPSAVRRRGVARQIGGFLLASKGSRWVRASPTVANYKS